MSFGVASVRLLQLTLLDQPEVTESEGSAEDFNSSPSSSLALSSSSSSTPRPRVITRALLQDPTLREEWLNGIDGEQTFLIQRDLVPQLYQSLHTIEGGQPQAALLSPAEEEQTRLLSPSTSPPLPPSALSTSTSASSALTIPSSLQHLMQRLGKVESISLTTAYSSRAQRQREVSGSSTIPPPPPLLPPLTPTQQRLFDLVAADDVDGFTTLYSPSHMSLDLPHPSHGGTLLHTAALHSHPRMTAHLLALSASPNARAFNHSTPLHWAAGAGSVECVRTLLSGGADPLLRTMTWWRSEGGRGSGQLAMHWAAESGWEDVVRLLAEWEPGAVVEEDERGRTVEHIAKGEGNSRVVEAIKEVTKEELVGVKLKLVYSGKRMKPMGQAQRSTGHER